MNEQPCPNILLPNSKSIQTEGIKTMLMPQYTTERNSYFQSLKIRQSTFLNYLKLHNLLILRLKVVICSVSRALCIGAIGHRNRLNRSTLKPIAWMKMLPASLA